MRSKVAALLAVPLLALAMLASWAGPASAETDTLIFHSSRKLHFFAPASAGQSASAVTTAETCIWDVFISKNLDTLRVTATTWVSCNAPMAQITIQSYLFINGEPRIDSRRIGTAFGARYDFAVDSTPLPCLPGVNTGYGAVYVVNLAGYPASDFGHSYNSITNC